jgi:hypothetical protein
MNATQLLKLMNRAPFEPFEVHLSDGAHIRVEHPYQIATQANSPVCVVFDDSEDMHIVSYRNITEVGTAPNGQA